MSNAFTAPYFQSPEAAREMLEGIRWQGGRTCAHCGSFKSYATKRIGLFRCAEPECRKDFTVTTRTVMERSKVPLHKWLMAFFLMASSKKGISAHQLHRMLGLPYQTAWFMAHRIRHAMAVGGLTATTTPPEPMGGADKIVEADETYYGKVEVARPRRKYLSPPTKGGKVGPGQKRVIVSLVERGGHVRSFHIPSATKDAVTDIVKANVSKDSKLFTDESRLYGNAKAHFAVHSTVRHSAGEYARGEVHTNTIEGYFSIFKRGMKGVYQHCAEKHLHRYLAEFDFRYNHRIKLGFTDMERMITALRAAEGKRLTYHQTH